MIKYSSIKEVFITENKKNYASEIQDIVHDIDLLIKENKVKLMEIL